MLDILDQLKHPDLFMQYDIYHMQMMGDNVKTFLCQYADKIGHVQFADVPIHRPQPSKTPQKNEKSIFSIHQINGFGTFFR